VFINVDIDSKPDVLLPQPNLPIASP